MTILGSIIAWFIIGYVFIVLTHAAGDWLVMIADARNTPRTWMVYPSLLLCAALWPISGWVARHCFYLSITGLRARKPAPLAVLDKRSSDHFVNDLDINSMYWHVVKPPRKDDLG